VQLYAVLIDIKKAFESVSRSILWKIMRKFGCPVKITNILADLHTENTKWNTNWRIHHLKWSETRVCSSTSPFQHIYLTAIMMIVDKKLVDCGVVIRYREDGGLFNLSRLRSKKEARTRAVTELQYADNIALLGGSANVIQSMTNTFESAYNALGLEIKATKTKRLRINCSSNGDTSLRVRNGDVEDVEQFNYLGSIVTRDGTLNAEIGAKPQRPYLS
jgi:hypothetical protein